MTQPVHRNSSVDEEVADNEEMVLQPYEPSRTNECSPVAFPISSLPALPSTETQPSTSQLEWPNIVTTDPMTQIMPTICYLQPISIVPTYELVPQSAQFFVIHNAPEIFPLFRSM